MGKWRIRSGPARNAMAAWLLSVCFTLNAVDPGSVTVATIDGQAITLAQIEEALLKKEGVETVEKWVHENLEHLDWQRLRDDDVLLQIGFNRLTRGEVVSRLLASGVGQVRAELIQLAVVERAIAKAGVVVTQRQLDRTWNRMKQAKEVELEAQLKSKVTFENWLKIKQSQTPEQFRSQPGFQVLAGLQALVIKQSELAEDDLRRWYSEHHDRYDHPAAVRLRVIHFPYRAEDGSSDPGDSKKSFLITPAERERCLAVASRFAAQIRSGETPWETLWPWLGKPNDHEAGEHGDVGFVPASGRRSDNGRTLPPAVMEAAFTAANALVEPPAGQPQLGQLAGPVVVHDGVDLLQVLQRRPALTGRYDEVREQIREDVLDADLDARTQALLNRLLTQGAVERVSLPSLLENRLRDLAAGSVSQGSSGP